MHLLDPSDDIFTFLLNVSIWTSFCILGSRGEQLFDFLRFFDYRRIIRRKADFESKMYSRKSKDAILQNPKM